MTRLYTLPDGTRVPSVTTVIDIIAQPGLEQWRLNVGQARAAQISRESAGFGTAVHAACEAVVKQQPWYGPNGDPLYPESALEHATPFADWIKGYRAFPSEGKLEGPEHTPRSVIASEQTVEHARLRYAGTLDLMVELNDGRTATVDLKTGKRVSETTPLQLEAYRRAGAESGLPLADTRLVLHMPRDRPGHLEVIEYEDHERDWRGFLACLSLWWRFRGGGVE